MRLAPPTAILVALAGLAACEEPFDVDLEGRVAHIVVEANLESGEAPLVGVRAVDVYGDPAVDAALAESFVTLENSDGRTFELPLVDDASPADSLARFLAPDEVIVAGTSYRLRVETPGFARLRSETTVPPRAGLAVARARPDSSGYLPAVYDSLDGHYSIGLLIEDPGPAVDRYHLLARCIGEDGRATAIPFLLARNVAEVENLGRRGALLTDVAFERGRFDNRLLVDAGVLESHGATALLVEVRVVSEPYFDRLADEGAGGQRVGAPLPDVAGHSDDNIAGGRGLFASYSSSREVWRLER